MLYLATNRELGPDERFAPDRLQNYADELILHAGQPVDRPVLVTMVEGTDETSEAGRAVEYQTFLRKYGNTYEQLEKHFSPYDTASLFFVAIDTADRVPIGVVRLIPPNTAVGTRTAFDVGSVEHWGTDFVYAINSALEQQGATEDDFTDASIMVDVASLVVNEQYALRYPPHSLAAAVIRASINYTLEHGYRDYVAVMIRAALRSAQNTMGPIARFVPGLPDKEYLDAPRSRPVFGNLLRYVAELKATDPERYKMLRDGSGRWDVADNITTIEPLDTSDIIRSEIG